MFVKAHVLWIFFSSPFPNYITSTAHGSGFAVGLLLGTVMVFVIESVLDPLPDLIASQSENIFLSRGRKNIRIFISNFVCSFLGKLPRTGETFPEQSLLPG